MDIFKKFIKLILIIVVTTLLTLGGYAIYQISQEEGGKEFLQQELEHIITGKIAAEKINPSYKQNLLTIEFSIAPIMNLDEVTISIDLYNTSNQIFKQETIELKNVEAGKTYVNIIDLTLSESLKFKEIKITEIKGKYF